MSPARIPAKSGLGEEHGIEARGLVLVVGPDGAGKTTVLDALADQLGHRLTRAHSRPGLIAGRPSDGGPVTDPHGQQPRGTVASLGKLAVVLLDTILGTWLRWRPLAEERLLVVERGWYDLAVDPHRYRLPSSFGPLVAALGRLVPRAELAVLLSGDPAAYHARKPEIGTAEVARQLEAWRRFAPRAARRVVVIDTVAQTAAQAAAQLRAALPTGRRWYRVPVAPRRLGLCATGPGPALRIYRPHRRVAQLASRANPLLLGLARRTASPPLPELAGLLSRDGHQVVQLAAMRSSAPGRWIVAAADRNGLHTVVKVGHDDAGLARESEALRHLRPTEEVSLPVVVGELEGDGWRALATQALPRTDRTPELDRVVALATAMTRGDLGVPVVHGDLAPWNLAADGDRVVAWDWEEAELGAARPLHDLTHYVIRSGILLARWNPEEAMRLLTEEGRPGARHLRALDLPVTSAPAQVRAYLARTVAADPAERTYREHLARLLPPDR